jgi:hypothetical protein
MPRFAGTSNPTSIFNDMKPLMGKDAARAFAAEAVFIALGGTDVEEP